jgi:hypothetical protein
MAKAFNFESFWDQPMYPVVNTKNSGKSTCEAGLCLVPLHY